MHLSRTLTVPVFSFPQSNSDHTVTAALLHLQFLFSLFVYSSAKPCAAVIDIQAQPPRRKGEIWSSHLCLDLAESTSATPAAYVHVHLHTVEENGLKLRLRLQLYNIHANYYCEYSCLATLKLSVCPLAWAYVTVACLYMPVQSINTLNNIWNIA